MDCKRQKTSWCQLSCTSHLDLVHSSFEQCDIQLKLCAVTEHCQQTPHISCILFTVLKKDSFSYLSLKVRTKLSKSVFMYSALLYCRSIKLKKRVSFLSVN